MVLCGVVMENTQENMGKWRKWEITSLMALLINVIVRFHRVALTRMEVTLKLLKLIRRLIRVCLA